MKSKQLARLAAKDPRIEEYEWDGESHWLHLAPGYIDTLTETHSVSEGTVKETLNVFRTFVCKE